MKTIIMIIGFIAIGALAQDCSGPFLDTDLNVFAPSEGNILSEPSDGPEDLAICKNLIGKPQCCSTDAWTEIADKYDELKLKVTTKREKTAKTIDDSIADEEENMDVMAEFEAEFDVIVEESEDETLTLRSL